MYKIQHQLLDIDRDLYLIPGDSRTRGQHRFFQERSNYDTLRNSFQTCLSHILVFCWCNHLSRRGQLFFVHFLMSVSGLRWWDHKPLLRIPIDRDLYLIPGDSRTRGQHRFFQERSNYDTLRNSFQRTAREWNHLPEMSKSWCWILYIITSLLILLCCSKVCHSSDVNMLVTHPCVSV
jgi:hypothetical protein